MTNAAPDMATLLKAAFDWWRDAGVDCTYLDTPQDWLQAASERAAANASSTAAPPRGRAAESVAPVPLPRIGGDRALWPQSLDRFAEWWMSEQSLCPSPAAARVAPAGPIRAPLMVIVPMPEQDDSAQLLAGPAGRLLDGFLAAAALSRPQIYVAAALPARIAAPDWESLASDGMGEVLGHHISLVAPERLLILGRTGVSTLLNNGSPNHAPDLRSFNHDGGSIPVAFGYDLEAMLAQPALKAGLWSRWLEWTGNEQL